jgi:hypothetical protein
MCFIGNSNDTIIEDYIKWMKYKYPIFWCLHIHDNLNIDAHIWRKSLKYREMMELFNKEFEKVLLDRWFHVKQKDTEIKKGLFSCGNSIL